MVIAVEVGIRYGQAGTGGGRRGGFLPDFTLRFLYHYSRLKFGLKGRARDRGRRTGGWQA